MTNQSLGRFRWRGVIVRISHTGWLAIIICISVLLRVGIALYLGDIVDAPSLLTDQRSYHALGERLISGYGFSFDRAWYPFTAANTPTAHWSFLYSLFVAAIYGIFGVHPLAVRLVQAVLGGALMPWLVFRLTRRLFSSVAPDASGTVAAGAMRFVPYAAAAISALYGYFLLYSATLMTETLYIAVVLWSLEIGLEVVADLQHDRRILWHTATRLGVSLGLAALLRQSILPWVPVFFAYVLWVALRRRRLMVAIRALSLSGMLLIVFILPWTYRNYKVYGTFLLLNSNTGYAMYSAQHPMHGTHFREFDAAPLPEGIGWGNEAIMDRQLMRLGVQFVLADPVRYLLLSLSRVRAFFEFWPTSDTTLLHNLGRVGSFALLVPFVVYGLWLWFRGFPGLVRHIGNRRALRAKFVASNALIFLFVIVYTVMHVLTWAMVRYRLPVDAVMMPIAGVGIVDAVQRLLTVVQAKGTAAVPMSAVLRSEVVPQRRDEEGKWH